MSPTRETLTDAEIVELIGWADWMDLEPRAALIAAALRELQERRALVPAEACPTCAVEHARGDVHLRHAEEMTRRLDAAEAKLRALDAENAKLRDWQVCVTSALQRPGGAFYEDVPQHVKELRGRVDAMAEALDRARVLVPAPDAQAGTCADATALARELTAAIDAHINDGNPLDVADLIRARDALAALSRASQAAPCPHRWVKCDIGEACRDCGAPHVADADDDPTPYRCFDRAFVQQPTPPPAAPSLADARPEGEQASALVGPPPSDAKEWTCHECGNDLLWCVHGVRQAVQTAEDRLDILFRGPLFGPVVIDYLAVKQELHKLRLLAAYPSPTPPTQEP